MSRLAHNDQTLSRAANELMLTIAAIEVADDHAPEIAGLIDRQDTLVSLLEITQPDTEAGLVAKAAALLAEGPECTLPSRQERLAISLATDILRTFGGKVLPRIPTTKTAEAVATP